MKKVLLIAAVACMAMTSCKKDYTCECREIDRTDPDDISFSYNNMKKKDAKKACDDRNATAYGIWECKLK